MTLTCLKFSRQKTIGLKRKKSLSFLGLGGLGLGLSLGLGLGLGGLGLSLGLSLGLGLGLGLGLPTERVREQASCLPTVSPLRDSSLLSPIVSPLRESKPAVSPPTNQHSALGLFPRYSNVNIYGNAAPDRRSDTGFGTSMVDYLIPVIFSWVTERSLKPLIAMVDWSSALALQCDLLWLLVNGGVKPNKHLQFMLQKTIAGDVQR